MYSELINELAGNFDSKLLKLAFHLILVGALGIAIKDFTTKIYQFISLKLSDFGRGTRIDVGGKVGQILKIGFTEVEIELEDDGGTFLIPLSLFAKTSKTILHHRKRGRK